MLYYHIGYILGGAKLTTVTCDAYTEIAKDMKSYKYWSMWAEDTADIENGTNDVDDFISGHVRTDKASISFNGAWAQNIDETEMFIDFMGDKGGARLDYYNKEFTVYTTKDGELYEYTPSIEETNSFEIEIDEFLKCIKSGKKLPSHIDTNIITARMMQAMYDSSNAHREIVLEESKND